jgi:hypothetical protein
MKYYMRIDDNPNSETYNKPRALYRFEVTDNKITTEWWNPVSKEWEDNPAVLKLTGLGGAENFFEVSEDKAVAFQNSPPRVSDE